MESIKISYCDSKIAKMILDIFGSTLKKLEFWQCGEMDMNYLASTCEELEHLTFHYTGINHSVDASAWTQKTFLPKLTYFRMHRGSCLGPIWGALIENKKELVCLTLDCCHIGTNVKFFLISI